MEKRPDALLLKFPGTNCDEETARALEQSGFAVETLPFSLITAARLAKTDLFVLSGGFSYGDYVMAGRLAQLGLEHKLGAELRAFHRGGGYLLGICNGFQILMRMGLLPEGSLIGNTGGRFMCRWSTLRRTATDSPWLNGLPDEFEFPIAHAEGRFVAPPDLARKYIENGNVTLLYKDNLNGSDEAIAGIQDDTRRVFGLMPHPERFITREQHYDRDWSGAPNGWGYTFFRSIHDEIARTRLGAAASTT